MLVRKCKLFCFQCVPNFTYKLAVIFLEYYDNMAKFLKENFLNWNFVANKGQVIWIRTLLTSANGKLGIPGIETTNPQQGTFERSQKLKSNNKTNNKLAFSKPSTLFPRIHWLSHVTETLHGEEACGTMVLVVIKLTVNCHVKTERITFQQIARCRKNNRMIQHLCESVTHFLRVEVWVGQNTIETIL